MSSVRVRRRKKKNRIGRTLVSGMGLLLVAVFGMQSVELQAKNQTYKEKIAKAERSCEEERDRAKQLEEKEKYMQTRKFIEEYAKEKLGLIYPNEVVFKGN